MKTNKRVCVIGAGSAGLVTVKELLDEGHVVTCFERHDEPGGTFCQSDRPDRAGAYDSTLLTISNYMMAFSSYPPDLGEKRRFWTAAEYQRYLTNFVQHFDLARAIRYGMTVTRVARHGEGWVVEAAPTDRASDPVVVHCDVVAVCTGSARVPNEIMIKGQDTFRGEIHHSAYYKNAKPFAGRRVLCVGMGETGVDVVNEVAQVAKRCVLSLRQFQPLIQRFPFRNVHTSDAYTSHALSAAPFAAGNARMKLVFKMIRRLSKREDDRAFAEWNLKAGHYFNGFNIKSEVFLPRLIDKTLVVNSSGIDHLEANRVVFADGTQETIDTVILNTGYRDEFSFLEGIAVRDVRRLYKHMIHPDLGASLAFIGWARPAAGGVPACSEMQARYLALLCSGKKQLPPTPELKQLIERHAKFEDEVFHRNPKVRSLVHYSTYMTDFAKVLGCSPWRPASFAKPRLLYRLWYGSQMPTLYRLYGPHSNYERSKQSIFSVPVALPPAEIAIMTIYAPITNMLAKLRVIRPDPAY